MTGFIEFARSFVAVLLSSQRVCSFGIALVLCMGAAAQESGTPSPTINGGVVRAEIAPERAWVRKHIAKLEHFMVWYDHLESVAQNDPEEALRQRLTADVCLASVLAPCCKYLTALFSPYDGFAPTRHYDFRKKSDLCFVPPMREEP